MLYSVMNANFEQFSKMYCERQQQTPEGLKAILSKQKEVFKPDGWMLLECVVLDSSKLGQYTILPYGPNNTYKQCPAQGVPISPRGLASDMSLVVSTLLSEDL